MFHDDDLEAAVSFGMYCTDQDVATYRCEEEMIRSIIASPSIDDSSAERIFDNPRSTEDSLDNRLTTLRRPVGTPRELMLISREHHVDDVRCHIQTEISSHRVPRPKNQHHDT